MQPLSLSLAGLQLPAKMPLGTFHLCQEGLSLKLAPAQNPQALPKVLGTEDTEEMSSFPTGEEDIFPRLGHGYSSFGLSSTTQQEREGDEMVMQRAISPGLPASDASSSTQTTSSCTVLWTQPKLVALRMGSWER